MFKIPGIAYRALATILLGAAGSSAQAQGNSLDNPGFDADLSGWEVVFEDRIGVWSEADAANSSESGSALLSNQFVSNGAVPLVLGQCIAVEGDTEYPYGGTLMVPPGQPDQTRAHIFVQAYFNADCTDWTEQQLDIFSDTVGEWVAVNGSIVTVPGTTSIRYAIGVFKPNGETALAEAHFDNLYFLGSGGIPVNPSMSASWFNPEESGHGIMIHLLNATQAWMCWFTFDLAGNPAWICALGVITGNAIQFDDAFTVEGGAFPPNFDPELIDEIPWGSIVVEFTGCDTGTMSWTTNANGFQSGEMPIIRLTDLWGVPCEEG